MKHMLRRTISPVLALAILGLAAVPAAAAGPDRSDIGAFTVDFPAGQVCDFAVRWEFDAGGHLLVFPVQPNGDQVVRSVGAVTGTITNLDGDSSFAVRAGTRQDLVFHADGTIDAIINGIVIAGYFPTDVGGPSMWQFRGHLHDELDGTFTATSHSHSGLATDLCAALT